MDKKLITVEEASTLLSIGRTRVYDLMQRHEIRSIKVGRSRRVVLDSINDFVNRKLDEAPVNHEMRW